MSLSRAIERLDAIVSHHLEADQVDSVLDGIAVLLRQEDFRSEASTTTLPASLVTILGRNECLFQAGRVAANLAADSDPGRLALVQAGYPQLAVDVYVREETESILISLLNLTIGSNEQVLTALEPRLGVLLEMAGKSGEAHLWSIVEAVSILRNTSVEGEDYILKGVGEEDVSDTAWRVAENLASGSSVLGLKALESRSETALRFIAASSIAYDSGNEFWMTLRDNLLDENLQAFALIAFANAVNDATAQSIVEILPDIVPLMITGTTDQTKHALFGLLRNLSVKPSNRSRLIDVVTRIRSMGILMPENDHLGSVQGAAIVLVKNLCATEKKAVEVFAPSLSTLIEFIQRTEEQPMRWEGTRVIVNILRTVKEEGMNVDVSGMAAALTDMFKTAKEHPLLLNEAMIGLVLLMDKDRDNVKQSMEGSGKEGLEGIITGDIAVPGEVRQNAKVLLSLLNADDAPQ